MIKPRYVFLVLIPVAMQLVFSLSSQSQIRYEELAESFRNVYWLRQGKMYDYLSYNIGWYATLNLFYAIAGFSLVAAKWYKVILFAISAACWLWVCHKLFGKRAAIPYLAYVLSPTLIYFSTLQALYGLDLIYLPILVALTIRSWQKPDLISKISAVCFGFGLSLSFFSYAVFYFSVPFMVLFFILYGRKSGFRAPYYLACLGLLVPIIYLWPIISKYRLFQFYLIMSESSQTYPHIPNWPDFYINLRHIFSDLFVKANSYNFEQIWPDFSFVVPIIPVLISIGLIYRYRRRLIHLKWYGGLVAAAMMYNLYVVQYKNGPISDSGMRRSTILLLGLYAVYFIGWYGVKFIKQHQYRQVITVVFLLLPLHHLLVYLPNISLQAIPSQFIYKLWFYDGANPPAIAIKNVSLKQAETPQLLDCRNLPVEAKYKECRYQETFAVLSLYCDYSHLGCGPIYGYDPGTDKNITLTTTPWDTFYWPH